MHWYYHQPVFAADSAPELPREFMTHGAWSGHRRFAYDLVRFARPRTIVELGTLYGTSFFTFCQAVKDGQLAARCFAVDTWKGDPHVGSYDDVVYQAVQAVTAREFPQIGTLVRSDFDGAVNLFADGSIDVLHIDGYHTYEAVHHDYTTWYPKLAENGIVLFHDTAVRLWDFGVYRLWEELVEHPHITFPHSNGLGVLFPKGCPANWLPLIENKDAFVANYAAGQV
ncbi:class I SAM-dependent methyltransferase [Paenibacillus dendritiformis]|uniref:class I SAM-dependent methyltransferase n=1 Tax=Paenibacillus dendritiformis TaxID=130049 RepID=UPI00248C4417|nr:class I SAM-dependent methyltransferase [Paenibacillus dendritiformis]WGU94566.1 class I SAM-dependent methyltransferase [Paenibacillus dendritiformis]